MTITKAINRITWRLKNGWKANENDVQAINTIIDFVNQKHTTQIADNELFAKLYIHVYGQFLMHYNTTVFDPVPQKELHEILDMPIEEIIEKFKQKLNSIELFHFFNEAGIENKHPQLKTSDQKREEVERLMKEIDKNPAKIDVIFSNSWDFETVKTQLESQINLAINAY